MMEVIRADQLADAGRRLARVFVDGFGQHLRYFSKDPVRLAAAFAHMFRTDCFFVAVEDGAVVAMAGITDGNEPAVELNAAHLRRELGLLKGSIAAAEGVRGLCWNTSSSILVTPPSFSRSAIATPRRSRYTRVLVSPNWPGCPIQTQNTPGTTTCST